MRLGELLIEAGAITLDQLEAALHAQVMWGARLGTALVELGAIDLDNLANALAAQHHVPAALATHFDRADRALQLLLSPNHAERFECVPLMRVGKRAVVVASAQPLPARAIAILADELAVDPERIIFAIAPELRIRYAIERVYKIARPQRFLRAPGTPTPTPRHVTIMAQALEAHPSIEELPDDDGIPIHTEQTPSERRSYVHSIVATTRVPSGAVPPPTPPRPPRPPRPDGSAQRADVLATLRRASDRDQIGRLVIGAVAILEPDAQAAVLLMVRSGVAVSWTSFRRDGQLLGPIAVPLDQLGLVPSVIRKRKQLRAAPHDLSDVDHALVVTLGVEGGEALVEPLVIADKVSAVLVVASRGGVDGDVIAEIAFAAAASFMTLMREATL
jgi:hypothetical protein